MPTRKNDTAPPSSPLGPEKTTAPSLLGDIIRRGRLSRGWTQKDLASALGTVQSRVSDLEAGRVSLRWLATPARVAVWEGMGLSLAEIVAAAGEAKSCPCCGKSYDS